MGAGSDPGSAGAVNCDETVEPDLKQRKIEFARQDRRTERLPTAGGTTSRSLRLGDGP